MPLTHESHASACTSHTLPVQVYAHKWHAGNSAMPYAFAAHLPSEYAIEPDGSAPRSIAAPALAQLQQSAAIYATVPATSLIVSGGHYDNSLRVFSLQSGALLQAVSAHSRPVSCIHVTPGARSGCGVCISNCSKGHCPGVLSFWCMRPTFQCVWRMQARCVTRAALHDDLQLQ